MNFVNSNFIKKKNEKKIKSKFLKFDFRIQIFAYNRYDNYALKKKLNVVLIYH